MNDNATNERKLQNYNTLHLHKFKKKTNEKEIGEDENLLLFLKKWKCSWEGCPDSKRQAYPFNHSMAAIYLFMNLMNVPFGNDGKSMMNVLQLLMWCICETREFSFITFLSVDILSNCSSVSSILSTIIGLHFGHVLVHFEVRFMISPNLCPTYIETAHVTGFFPFFPNYVRIIQLDWSTGVWWVLLSSF